MSSKFGEISIIRRDRVALRESKAYSSTAAWERFERKPYGYQDILEVIEAFHISIRGKQNIWDQLVEANTLKGVIDPNAGSGKVRFLPVGTSHNVPRERTYSSESTSTTSSSACSSRCSVDSTASTAATSVRSALQEKPDAVALPIFARFSRVLINAPVTEIPVPAPAASKPVLSNSIVTGEAWRALHTTASLEKHVAAYVQPVSKPTWRNAMVKGPRNNRVPKAVTGAKSKSTLSIRVRNTLRFASAPSKTINPAHSRPRAVLKKARKARVAASIPNKQTPQVVNPSQQCLRDGPAASRALENTEQIKVKDWIQSHQSTNFGWRRSSPLKLIERIEGYDFGAGGLGLSVPTTYVL